MPDLYLHGRAVDTVFELLGLDENDITSSLGWTLRESPTLASTLLKDVLPGRPALTVNGIRLQEYAAERGITDIEIEAGDVTVILEAKRGWTLPGADQLHQYARRRPDLILVVSECSASYAAPRLPRRIGGVDVVHRAWREIARFVKSASRSGERAEQRVLSEFLTYLETAMPVQDQESNLVFVVSLSTGAPARSAISWIDIVEKKRCYFHPVGDGWPKEPPNYIAFRYFGKLQSIRHIDKYVVGTDPHQFVPEMRRRRWDPHFFYTLGRPIRTEREVRTGKLFRNGRVWAALDLLLTCRSISKARDETDRRRERWTR